jgi:hypothetical protein
VTQPTCDLCGRPLPDQGFVCSKCAEVVGVDLARIIDLAPEVEITVAKLARVGTSLGGGTRERPLPFDAQAADRADALRNTLSTWARHVAESIGVQIPARRPGELGAQQAARFLGDRLNWIRHHQEAAKCFGDLSDAARELERLVGRPRDHWYAGACWADLGELDEAGDPLRCPQELYAPKGARTVRCRFCGAEHDADARRQWLLDQVKDQLLHAEWIARALMGFGLEQVTSSRIRGYAHRGRLAEHGHDQAGRPMYRVGDVLDLVHEQDQLEQERARKRDEKAQRRTEQATRGEVA